MGKTYEYEYDMKTMTSLLNKEEKAAEIKLAAKVFFTPASKCQLSMQCAMSGLKMVQHLITLSS